jgi:hypothetical protein
MSRLSAVPPLDSVVSFTVLFFVSDNLIGNSAVRSEAHGSQVEIRTPNPARQYDFGLPSLRCGHS